MTLYGVTGHPVLQSRSPHVFNRLFPSRGVDAIYTRLGASTGAGVLALARKMSVAGLNVTSPFKEEVYRLVADRDTCSRRLLAANTVALGASSTAVFNTDPDGVRHALAARAIPTRGQRVIVLGSGGAARAAAHALVAGAANVVVASRTEARAAETAAAAECEWSALEELPDLLRSASGLVSCLPPGIDIVEERWLRPGMWILDANYHRPVLAAKARRCGCVVADGLDWLAGQAAGSYRVFVDRQRTRDDLAGHPTDSLAAEIAGLLSEPEGDTAVRHGVAIAGMMAAGKSTVAAALGRRLGRPVVDTDEVIAGRTGHDIPWLFAHRGEEEFRRIEADVIAGLTNGPAPLMALGGGSLGDPATRAEVQRVCRVVWLWASPACLAERAAAGRQNRPLLDADRSEARLAALLSERTRAYASSADLVVDAERPPEEVVDLIEFEIRHLAASS